MATGTLQVFIDESGTFAGYHDRAISLVGALAIPDGKINRLKEKYGKMRASLPTDNGEVKGRLLKEDQIDKVVRLLARNDVVYEVSLIDLGLHKKDALESRKREHAEYQLSRAHRFREPDRQKLEAASRQISATSLPLYIQSIITFDVLLKIINHVPLYFAQRQPQELGKFVWVVDGKDRTRVTNWEIWWSWYARGAIANMSKRYPAMVLEGADYTQFDRFNRPFPEKNGEIVFGTDLELLLADLRFSPSVEPGLEFIDIVVNATRRALTGNLNPGGWSNIPRLMIHRKEPYIGLLMLIEGPDAVTRYPAYAPIIHAFSRGGRSMLSPRFIREADE